MSIVGGQRTFFTYPGASAEFGEIDIDYAFFSNGRKHLAGCFVVSVDERFVEGLLGGLRCGF